jgi:hypothetical protein
VRKGRREGGREGKGVHNGGKRRQAGRTSEEVRFCCFVDRAGPSLWRLRSLLVST